MPKKADTTSAAQRHPETPPSPASVRASTPAGWLPPRPTRRPTGRLWRQGRRTPGRCALSDRVARQPRSTRRHLQLPVSLPFAWHSNPRQAPLLPSPAQSGAQRNGHGLGPRPTGPRYGSGGHSHLVRRHAYLSCSMHSSKQKTPHHILWHWSHSRCAFVVQKCEGRLEHIHVSISGEAASVVQVQRRGELFKGYARGGLATFVQHKVHIGHVGQVFLSDRQSSQDCVPQQELREVWPSRLTWKPSAGKEASSCA